MDDEHRTRGNEAFKSERYPDAIVSYTSSLAITPSVPAVLCNRSMCYFRLADYANAITDGVAARDSDPTFAKAYYRIGAALHARGNSVDAVMILADGLAVKPGDMDMKELQDAALLGVPVFRPIPSLFERCDPTGGEAYAAMVMFVVTSKPRAEGAMSTFKEELGLVPPRRYARLIEDRGNVPGATTKGLDLLFALSMLDKGLFARVCPDGPASRCVRCGRVPPTPWACQSCGAQEFCGYECQERSMWWHQEEDN